VIYRRVLRYYSGEEDGLGMLLNSWFSFLLLLCFNKTHTVIYPLSFYALFLDMRKALSRDVEKKSVIPLKRPVTPDELEYD